MLVVRQRQIQRVDRPKQLRSLPEREVPGCYRLPLVPHMRRRHVDGREPLAYSLRGDSDGVADAGTECNADGEPDVRSDSDSDRGTYLQPDSEPDTRTYSLAVGKPHRRPDRGPDRESHGLTDRRPDQISDRVPDRLPDRLPDHASDAHSLARGVAPWAVADLGLRIHRARVRHSGVRRMQLRPANRRAD
jgi:hypothetical protein